MRHILASLLILAVSSPSYAQTSPTPMRVRLTLTPGHDIPGLQQGARATGLAISLNAGTLEFAADPDTRILSVPVSAIQSIERERQRPSRLTATNVGIATGMGAFLLTWLVAIGRGEQAGEGELRLLRAALVILPATVGGLAGWAIRRIRWEPISVEQLRTALNP